MPSEIQKHNEPPVLARVKAQLPAMLKALPSDEASRTRFRQAAVAVAMNNSIGRCTPESVASAIYACARMNLIPDPVLHHVAIVPFKNKGRYEATVIVEYRGLIELMKRANPALSIKAGTVYANDQYTLIEGTDDRLEITKRWYERGKDEPGEPLLFYAVAKEPGAEPVLVVLPAIEARKIGQASKAGMSPGKPWHDHFERMGEKTCIRRIERFLRIDPDKDAARQLQEALRLDERSDEVGMAGIADDSDSDMSVLDGFASDEPDEGAATAGGEPAVKRVASKQTGRSSEIEEQAPPTPEQLKKGVTQKLGVSIPVILDNAGIEASDANKRQFLDFLTNSESIDSMDTPSIEAILARARHMMADEVKAVFAPTEPAKAAESQPEGQQTNAGTNKEPKPLPINRVQMAWSTARESLGLQKSIKAADKYVRLRANLDPDTMSDAAADSIISDIENGNVKFDLYE